MQMQCNHHLLDVLAADIFVYRIQTVKLQERSKITWHQMLPVCTVVCFPFGFRLYNKTTLINSS